MTARRINRQHEVRTLRALRIHDNLNAAVGTRPLNLREQYLLIEGLYLSCFVDLERAIEELFFVYAMGGVSDSGTGSARLVEPKTQDHAEKLILAGKKYFEWADTDELISRCEVWFHESFPFRDLIASRSGDIKTWKRIRNRVAHRSNSSIADFEKVITSTVSGAASGINSVDQYLFLKNKKTGTNYFTFHVQNMRTLVGSLAKI